MPNLLRILCGALIIILSVFSIYSALQIKKLGDQQVIAEKNYTQLAEAQKQAALENSEQLSNLAKSIETNAQENLKQIETLSNQLAVTKYELQEAYDLLAVTRSYLLPLYDENAAREAAQPLPFSYFKSEEWLKAIEDLRSKFHEPQFNWMVFIGEGSETTVDTPKIGGDILIDSVFVFSAENFHLENKKPNTAYIQAPGLAHIDYGVLTVTGDKGLDQVILDGCLKWQEENTNSEFVTWRALDEGALKGKQVKISTGLQTKIQDKCDNRYLSYYENMLVAEKLYGKRDQPVKNMIEGANIKFEPPKKSFGGIGMAYKYEDFEKTLRVLHVLPDKPAHKAGIRAHDTITQIDGHRIENINQDEIMDMMRGEVGSTLKLSYIPKDKTRENEITVTVKRESIAPKDFQNKKPAETPAPTAPEKNK